MKKIKWNVNALDFIKSLDVKTRREIGALLFLLQMGEVLGSPQAKPMKVIHQNAYELRIRDNRGIYRVIYVLKFRNTILIPHAFVKKTQKTPRFEIEKAKKKLGELICEII